MKTYKKKMQTDDGEALADEIKVCLDLGDKLIAISDKDTPKPGVRTFTFEESET